MKRNPSYTLAVIAYSAVLIAGIAVSVATKNQWWIVALVAIACHIFLSIQQVQPNEWGALLFLGKALKNLDDGPVFAFWPLFRVIKEVKTVFQVIVGSPLTDKEGKLIDEPEITEGATVLKEREPFRVNFLAIDALPKKADLAKLPGDTFPPDMALPEVTEEMVKRFKDDPLHGALTCDPQLVFWFGIKDYMQYIRVVPDVKTLSRNISGIAKATLQECAGRVTVGMLIAHNELICRRLTYRIEQLIGEPHAQFEVKKENPNWGVNFQTVQIYSPGLPRTVNISLSENTAAGYKKRMTITTSEGEAQKLENVGAANAKALELLRIAEATGAAELAKVAQKPEGVIVLQMKTLAEALQKGNVTILPADLSILASAVASIKTVLGKGQNSGPNNP